MTTLRHNWTFAEVQQLFQLPLNDLLFQAHIVYRQNFDVNKVQISTLLSIKTGTCPEDCAYCPQSAHYSTGVEKQSLMSCEDVIARAKAAKANGAERFCMGAGWRNPPKKDFPKVLDMIREVKALGLETCATLGMLDEEQAQQLKQSGLDYYNHNLDTSPEYYNKIITTRTYQERLDTLQNVRDAGMNVCCGGIMGMGEQRDDRINFLIQLANLPEHPGSVPINRLIPIPGTPLENQSQLDAIEFVRTIAIARIIMPKSYVRLSAGRESMSDELQAMCFFAGANSIHYGEKLLVTANPSTDHDHQLFQRLGINQFETANA